MQRSSDLAWYPFGANGVEETKASFDYAHMAARPDNGAQGLEKYIKATIAERPSLGGMKSYLAEHVGLTPDCLPQSAISLL